MAVPYIYPNSGTYTVFLVTTDINGCKDTIVKPNYIRVNGPKANFTATNVSGCRGITTTFNDLSTTDGLNAIVNWRWNFGDGSTSISNAFSLGAGSTFCTGWNGWVKFKGNGNTCSLDNARLLGSTPGAAIAPRTTLGGGV